MQELLYCFRLLYIYVPYSRKQKHVLLFRKSEILFLVLWRNGEDAGLVFQGSVVRASAQEIFHSNSGLLSFKKPETVLWTIAKYCYYYYY